jgi:tetratricopeptide (TPR) repeat protein
MTRKLIGLTVAIFCLIGVTGLFAQEKVAPLSDYQYKKDYPQYEAIKKEADVQKRADALLAFVKERGISKMLLYAANDYMACVKPQLDKKDWAKAVSMTESFWALVPTAEAAKAADPTRSDEFIKDILVPTQKLLLSSLVTTYYQAQNWPKAAEMAEKTYELAPDKSLLPAMLDIYSKFNVDKFLATGQKMLAEFGMDQAYSVALQMAQAYIQKQDIAAATDMFTKIMDVYGDKVPPNVPEPQWNATRAYAYGVIASPFYQKKDYPKAMELYEKVIKFDPKKDDVYYYLGMCKWQTKDQEGAIAAFAKAVVLNNKTLAPKAKQYMEDLYKAQHSGSLDGLDQVLAKAKSDLGL